MVEVAADSFRSLDVLVDNAGSFPPMPLSELDLATLRRIIDVNLVGLFLRTVGDPDDIGRMALFLSSDLSSYMTGEQVVVDGGRLLT